MSSAPLKQHRNINNLERDRFAVAVLFALLVFVGVLEAPMASDSHPKEDGFFIALPSRRASRNPACPISTNAIGDACGAEKSD